MFFNYKILVKYRLRPNKKSEGTLCALPLWISGLPTEVVQQAKVMKTLSKIHRVNPDAIEDFRYIEIQRELKGVKWLRETIKSLKGKFA